MLEGSGTASGISNWSQILAFDQRIRMWIREGKIMRIRIRYGKTLRFLRFWFQFCNTDCLIMYTDPADQLNAAADSQSWICVKLNLWLTSWLGSSKYQLHEGHLQASRCRQTRGTARPTPSCRLALGWCLQRPHACFRRGIKHVTTKICIS